MTVALKQTNLTNTAIATIICDRAIGVALDHRQDAVESYRCYTVQTPGSFIIRYPISIGEKTIEDAKHDFSGTIIQYILATPIETPLSEEELAAYASLHTYRGNTTISNDASAHMEIEYAMDAKKYIDSLVAGGSTGDPGGGTILPATVE